jgi:hypothetical protein
MGYIITQKFALICDRCSKTTTVTKVNYMGKDKGWILWDSNNILDDSSKRLLCPNCEKDFDEFMKGKK